MKINYDLKRYIEKSVLPLYDTNIAGHDREHIEFVIERSFELAREFDLDVDVNMIYVIAAFHDIGYKENPDNHEEVSSRIFREDDIMTKYFTAEEIDIMADAIVDHRASLEYEARSVYGKLVSSADREISVHNMLKRSILFQADKHKSEHPSLAQVIDYSYKKLSSKYGKGGYAKMYFPDEKYKNYLNTMQDILSDKEKFVKYELDVIDRMSNKDKTTLEVLVKS